MHSMAALAQWLAPSLPMRPFDSPHPTTPSAAQDAAHARDCAEFAEFIAGQDPLDAAAAGWMVRRQDGLTPEEQAELEQWLAADPAHAEALEQVEGVWGRMDELPEESLEALKTGLAPARAARCMPASPDRRSWLRDLVGRLMPQAAAAALAFGVVGGGWYGWSAWQGQPTYTQTLATARGQQKQVQLPDGSMLWLDTATQIEVRLYRQRREVRLSEGQVLFAVQPNAEQPFDVLAGATRVTVVGTRFAVRRTHSGLGGDGAISVVVEQGRVRVAAESNAAAPMELGAGQSVSADAAGALGLVSTGAAAPAAWREGRISFDGVPLAQALAEFERYGDTGLVVRDPEVAALKVHGSFELQQVGAFARALPQVLPVRLRRIEGRSEIISSRP